MESYKPPKKVVPKKKSQDSSDDFYSMTELKELDEKKATLPNQIETSEELIDLASFKYLQVLAQTMTGEICKNYPGLIEFHNIFFDPKKGEQPYQPDRLKTYKNIPITSYNNLYSIFLQEFQKEIGGIQASQKKLMAIISSTNDLKLKADLINQVKAVDRMIDCIYNNDNGVLNLSAQFASKALKENRVHALSHKSEKTILSRSRSNPTAQKKNLFDSMTGALTYHLKPSDPTPHGQERHIARLKATFGPTFQPQLGTNIPSARSYAYKKDKKFPQEYRFGTQAERIEGKPRANPFFPAWLEAKNRRRIFAHIEGEVEKKYADEIPSKASPYKVQPILQSSIDHIYFNNLGLDRSQQLVDTFNEGLKEKEFTDTLHLLESQYPNLAVITLPADKGVMDHSLLDNTFPNLPKQFSLDSARDLVIRISTNQKSGENYIHDFYISDKVKQLLYTGLNPKLYISEQGEINKNEEDMMNALWTKSLIELGMADKKQLTQAEFQAVFFHFIKFEVTNFIIERLGPESFNFTCKDAIDRGGIASLYYNLIKSIESGHPISKDEFFEGLHGAPTLVKGRGMNTHLDRGWNAISAYMDGQIKLNNQHKIPAWLFDMRRDYENSKIIDKILEEFTYEQRTKGKLAKLTPDDYQTYTQSKNHSNPGHNLLSAIKGKIASELRETLLNLQELNLEKPQLIELMQTAVNDAFKKSANARRKDFEPGKLEDNLKKLMVTLENMKKELASKEPEHKQSIY